MSRRRHVNGKLIGATVSAPRALPEHGVRIVFVTAPNGKVELMEPLGEASPIAGFLARNEDGMHHICYEVEDIESASQLLEASGARVNRRWHSEERA